MADVFCIIEKSGPLSRPTTKTELTAPLVYNNSQAHSMRYVAYENGPLDLTGMNVTASFMKSNNETVEPIIGTISENVAEVVLPASCYVTTGRFAFTMNLNKPTPTEGIDAFSTSTAYSKGDLVVYSDAVYRFTAAHAAGAWTGTDAVLDCASRTVMWVEGIVQRNSTNTIIDPGTPVGNIDTAIGNAQAAATAANTAAAAATDAAEEALGNFAGEFDATAAYAAGTYVTYTDGKMYLLSSGHEANATWANTTKTAVTVGEEVAELKSALETVEGAVALGSDTLLPLAWESGSLSTTDGSEEADVSRRRTDYIPVTAGSIYATYESPVSGFMVFWYDSSKNYISGSRTSWVNSSGSTVTMNASGVYYRILAKRSGSPTPLTADEIKTFKVLIAPIWDKDIFDAMQSIAKEYNTASSGYSVGDYCTHAGKMYVCISSVSQGDAWAAAKWQETDAGAELKQANADIAVLESANLDAASVFQKYDATMSAIIKNFKMQSNEYKYIVISDIRRNYSSKTGFTIYYYDNDTYAVGVRHTLLQVYDLSSASSNSYSHNFDNGGFIQFDFDVSGQTDGYRNTTTTATNRIKPAVIERIVETPYASNYGLNVSNFMLTSGNTPIFTWVDDDTDPTGVTRVKAICDTLGIKATFACVTDKLAQNSGALATTLLGYQEEGFHITSHSHTHTKGTENDPFWYPTDYTDVALSEADLIESLTTLNEYGFLDSNLFVTPGGNRNAALLKMISKWCPCVIGANGGANHKFGTGRANINRIFIRPEAEGGETLQTYKDMIDAAVTAGDWLIFGTHSGIPAQWDETLINNVLSYALTKNVDFMTLNQAWKIRKYNYDLYDMFT